MVVATLLLGDPARLDYINGAILSINGGIR
ncbi:MAG: hypothetical protein ACI8RZ_005569 [Myxococcota bacterium]